MSTPKQAWKRIYRFARMAIKKGEWIGSGEELFFTANGLIIGFCEYCGSIEIENKHQSKSSLVRMLGFAELRLFHELADIECHNPKTAGYYFKKSRDYGFKLP